MFANLTPPVALASFAAAGLSGGNPMKTGIASVKLALGGFIIPFMFVFNGKLLLEGTGFLDGIQVVLTASIGVTLIAAAVEGYLFKPLPILLRLVSLISAFLLIDSATLTDLAGIGGLVLIVIYQKLINKKEKHPDVKKENLSKEN